MEKTPEQGQAKQAMITCLRALAASPKSSRELRRKLEGKGYPAKIIDQALNNIEAQGILNDTVYAKDLQARLISGKRVGRHKIAFELKRHGISKKISTALLETISHKDEADRALEQAQWKWSCWSRVEPQKRKKRLYDFLIRKGYDFQIAQDILQKISKEPADDLI